MIVKFSDPNIENVGNKARFLIKMKNNGFNVPDGFVVDSNTYVDEVAKNEIDQTINLLLNQLKKDNIFDISRQIISLFDNFVFSKDVCKQINKLLDKNKLYAVRSSGSLEDLGNYSFAGQYQTFLNVDSKKVINRVIDCYRSMFSENILSYLINNNIPTDSITMSVIVQEMVPSQYSGICFTVDPVTGNDKTMLIEIGKGLGENIVSGQNKPEQYRYNWYDKKYTVNPNNHFVSEQFLEKIASEFYKIMQFFGYPCDIEFAIVDNELFILQARQITKIEYQGYQDIWTTADFKDGGVSASVCTPYMWSLYEYIWEYTLRKFIIDSKILRSVDFPPKVGDMFYGRCYWNLSVVKKTMSKVVGYKERDFDNEYGITPTYEGDGETTGVTPVSIFAIIKMAIAQSLIVKKREKNAEKLKSDLLQKYYAYKGMYDSNSISDIKQTWKQLTHDDYLMSESTYFWQIFINTIHQALNKEKLLKYIDESDYLLFIGNIDNISHLLPFYIMWDVSREIRNNNKYYQYWTKNNVQKIVHDTLSNVNNHALDKVRKVINMYGYHSDKELDVTYPCYYEDITPIVANIQNLVFLDDSHSPKEDQHQSQRACKKRLKELKKTIGPGNLVDLEKKISKIREMLWWREEFRDISTRFYYLIRIYTIELAKTFVKEGVLNEESDIWFTKVGDIWDYFDEEIDEEDLNEIINKNKQYYNAYRNYISENEIGQSISISQNTKITSSMKGLAANNGIVTGVARVIESFDEIDKLQEGDILVTKFTDTGWTPKFAILKGIVTEYGGVLCHAAIVAREYGIPAIVSATNIMQQIKDGEIITINGTTGEIKKGNPADIH